MNQKGIKAGFFLEDQELYYPPQFIQDPIISVILPTYCRGSNGMLDRAIQSVLNQTFKQFELIILDDGSTDATSQVIRSWQEKDNRILYVRHALNSGLPGLRANEGMLLARGQYVTFQHDDDTVVPEAYQILLNSIQSQKYPSLVYGKCLAANSLGQHIGFGGQPFNAALLMYQNIIPNTGVLFPRFFAEESGGIDCHLLLKKINYWELWMRWSKKYAFIYTDSVVSYKKSEEDSSIPSDKNIIQIYKNIDREKSLKLENFTNFVLDDLVILESFLPEDKIVEFYSHIVSPWYQKLGLHSEEVDNTKVNVAVNLNNKKVKILFIGPHVSDTSTIFQNNLNSCLGEEFVTFFIPQIGMNLETIQLSDYCIFSRCYHPDTLYYMQMAKSFKKPVIYILDDDLLGLYELGKDYAFIAPGTPTYNGIVQHIQIADLVVTFSDVVTQVIQLINPRVKTLNPNIVQKSISNSKLSSQLDGEPLRIMYSGSEGKRLILSSLWSAFQQFSLIMGNKVEFYFWGVNIEGFPPLFSPVYSQPAIANYSEYLTKLSNGDFHVFLAPLDDRLRCQKGKCCIKYLEATAAGGIGIYSDAYPYRDIIDGGYGIKTPHTVLDWFNTLNRVISLSVAQRQEIWTRARAHILKNYTTESQIGGFVEALQIAKRNSETR